MRHCLLAQVWAVALACGLFATGCFADVPSAPVRKPTAISAGPLEEALQALARDRDLQVAYASEEVNSLITPGASGELTIDEALTQLLRNTGLTYRHSGENGISILRAPPARSAAPEKKPPRNVNARARRAQADPQSKRARNSALEEVLITAQRRRENLQAVPIAAAVFQGSELAGKAVTQLNDLQYAVPSLSIGNAGLANAVNIRGVGLASGSPAVANGVAVYVDGLFQTPTLYSNQLYDIDDVEVLRGPQGTLVGTNSTGGAILINSHSPQFGASDGYFQVGVGNYDAWNAQGAFNLPVSDTLALRVAAEFTQHESFYHSVGPAYT